MIRIEEHDGSDSSGWDDLVRASKDGTVMHLYAWRKVLERAYGHRTFYLEGRDEGRLVAVLPLALIRSPWLTSHLVSMPYMDYGGVCASGGEAPKQDEQNEQAEQALIARAERLAREHQAKLVLRYARRPRLSLPLSLDKVTMLMRLGADEGALWKRLPATRRNRIRKARRQGVEVSFPGRERLEEFYDVFATNMRDLGSPVHGLAFFEGVLEELGEAARLVLVHHEERAIGAGLMLIFKGMISIPWISSLREARRLCPYQALYWEVMRFGIREGLELLDFGRSSRDSGSFEAKRQWGADPSQLHWFYWPEAAAPPGQDVRKLSWAIPIWQRLPMRVANRVGPWLRAGIPN